MNIAKYLLGFRINFAYALAVKIEFFFLDCMSTT